MMCRNDGRHIKHDHSSVSCYVVDLVSGNYTEGLERPQKQWQWMVRTFISLYAGVRGLGWNAEHII